MEIQKKIYETKNYLKNLYEDKVNGIINVNQFKCLVNDYNKNEDIYNNQIKAIENEITFLKTKEEKNTKNKTLFSKYQKLENLNRVVVESFIDKIYIGKLDDKQQTRDIEIRWNFE